VAVGNMVSQLGFWGQYVAVGWTARSLTTSNFLVTVAFAAQWLPSLLLSPIAGVFADRYDRRRIVLLGNLGMVIPPLLIGLLVQTHRVNMVNLVILVVLGGAGQAFTQPAAAAFIPALVPTKDLQSAVALNAGMSNSTRVIGPALAALLIRIWGVPWGFHINAISYLAVAAACVMVHARPERTTRTSGATMAELRLGIAYTKRNKAVGRLLLFVAVEAFCIMHSALMPIFARDVLHGTVATFGLLSAAPGIGFVGAAFITTMAVSGRQQRAALVGSSAGLAIAELTFALSRSVPLSVGALGLFGLSYMTITTTVTTMLIAATDDAYRGRVLGVFAMFSIGVFPINSLIAGALASLLGAPGTVLVCGIALALFATAFFASGSLSVIRSGTEHTAA
jgi:predicted MFS family arabinose efflux permease